MRAVVLAAGEGRRLSPYTADRPKCLVELGGRTLLSFQVETLRSAGIRDLTLVTGYLGDRIRGQGFATVHNPRWAETNMVASLMCAKALLDGGEDVVVAYADILYEPRVLRALCECPAPVSTTVDTSWRHLWELRMENPLSDAETLRLDAAGNIRELGRRPESYDEVEAQYMGLIKIRADTASRFAEHFRGPDRMEMTGFLQSWVDSGQSLRAVPVSGGWLEVDTAGDLERYRRLLGQGRLDEYFRIPVSGGIGTPG